MNRYKELLIKYRPLMIKINNIVLIIGLLLIVSGLTASYQANKDATALNESLYYIATHGNRLTDGTTYYYVGLYNTTLDFNSRELIDKAQCYALYGVNK